MNLPPATVTKLPAAGWSEVRDDKRVGQKITYTEHGASVFASPPHLPGWVCFFVARVGDEHTTWSYRPIENKGA